MLQVKAEMTSSACPPVAEKDVISEKIIITSAASFCLS
jgi:hypothetical protein